VVIRARTDVAAVLDAVLDPINGLPVTIEGRRAE